MTFEELIISFKEYLISKKVASITLRAYLSDANHFFRWFRSYAKDKQLVFYDDSSLVANHLDKVVFESYKLSLQNENLPLSSINRHLSALRKLGDFLVSLELLKNNPVTQVTNISKQLTGKAIITSSDLMRDFKNYLHEQNNSSLTIKNYLSDISQFISWMSGVTHAAFNPTNLTSFYITEYKSRLVNLTGQMPNSINRKLSSLRVFVRFCQSKYDLKSNPFEAEEIISLPKEKTASYSPIPPVRMAQKTTKAADKVFLNPVVNSLRWLLSPFIRKSTPLSNISKEFYAPISLKGLPLPKKIYYYLKYTRPNWYKSYQKLSYSSYLNLAILILFCAAVGFGLGQQLFGSQIKKEVAALPTTPPRYMSFQGRLTDNNDNPVIIQKSFTFSIYDALSSGNQLWSETKNITPDPDGIFSTLLGDAYPIEDKVFRDYSAIWLEVTVDGQTLSPRQRIATVAYALNAEYLQGYPASTSAIANTIPAIDDNGALTLAAATPVMQSSGANFTIKSKVMTIQSSLGVGGLNISDSNSLQIKAASAAAALRIDQTGSGDLFSASASGVTKATLDSTGSLLLAGNLNLQGTTGISSSGNDADLTFSGTGTHAITASAGTLSLGAYTLTGNITGSGSPTITGLGQLTVDNLRLDGNTLDSTSGDLTLLSTGELYFDDSRTAAIPFSDVSNTSLTSGTSIIGAINTAYNTAAGSSAWTVANQGVYPTNTSLNLYLGGSATSSAKFMVLGTTKGTLEAGTASTSGQLTMNRSTTNYINSLGGSALSLRTSPGGDAGLTDRLYIDGAGNVGIGTTGPTEKLQIDGGGMVVTGANALTTGVNGMFLGFTGNIGKIYSIQNGTSYRALETRTSTFTAYTTPDGSTWNTGLHITTGGKVGIGTTSPLATLDIRGLTLHQPAASASANSSYAALVANNDGLGDLFTASSSGVGKFVITQTGNVGIGTTSPTSKLTVTGDMEISSGGKIYPGGLGNSFAYLNESWGMELHGQNTRPIQIPDSSLLIGYDQTDATDRGTGNLLVSGNVGIGTTSPGYLLDLGGLVANTKLALYDDSGNIYGLGIASNDFRLHLPNTAADFHFYDAPAGNALLTIKGTGNVGIGTTSPTNKLNVQSDPSSTTAQFEIGPVGGGSSSTSLLGKMRFRSTFDAYPADQGPRLSAQIVSGYNGGVWGNEYLAFGVGGATDAANDPAEKMRIRADGNVGIGTTAPGYKLDVVGTASISGQLNTAAHIIPYTTGQFDLGSSANHWANIYADNIYGGSAGVSGFWQRTSGSLAPTNITDALNLGATATTSALVHFTGTSGQNSWINTGNVGIGTTSPDSLLHVYSSNSSGESQMARFYAPSTTDGQDISLYLGKSSATDLAGTISYHTAATAANSYLQLGLYGTSGPLVVGKNNVGIGTTGPNVKAEVLKAAGAPANSGTASTAHLRLSNDSASGIGADFGLIPSSPYGLWIQSTNVGDLSQHYAISLNPNGGNVGVGTTNPLTNLQVGIDNTGEPVTLGSLTPKILIMGAQNSTTEDSLLKLVRPVTSGVAYPASVDFKLKRYDTTGVAPYTQLTIGLKATSSYDISDVVNVLTLRDNGNVGIGTTSPGYKLDVIGTASISGQLNLASHIIPYTTGQFDLGSSANHWANIYADNIYGGSAGVSGFWQRTSGSLAPTNITDALNLGAIATSSALVHFTGTSGQDSYINTGNVGIGTTSPSGNLHVVQGTSSYESSPLKIQAPVYPSMFLYSDGSNSQNWGLYGALHGYGILEITSTAAASDGNPGHGTTRLMLTNGGNVALGGAIADGDFTGASMVIKSGNVGIGTTSPAYLLDVNTTTRARSNFLAKNTGTIGSVGLVTGSDVSTGYMEWRLPAADGASGTRLGYMGYDTADVTLALENSADFVVNGGNVGIGTTAPRSQLQIGTLANNSDLYLDDLTGYGARSVTNWIAKSDATVIGVTQAGGSWLDLHNSNATSNNGALLTFSSTDAFSANVAAAGIRTIFSDKGSYWVSGDLTFLTSNAGTTPKLSEKMRIDKNGNVGIGTTAPGYLLDVRGTASISGQLNTASHIIPYTTGQFDLGSSTNHWANIYADNIYGGSAGVSGFWQRTSGSLAPTNITDALNLGATATSSALVHFTGTSGQNSYINTGNVGIGTTAPGAKLDVNLTQTEANSGLAAFNVFDGYYNYHMGWATKGTVGLSLYGESTEFYVDTRSSEVLHLAQGGSPKLTIKSGNVGIGTTGPLSQLQVGAVTNISTVVSYQSLYGNNVYFDGSNWRYVTSQAASAIRMSSINYGDIAFHTIGSGTAGDALAATWDTTGVRMVIQNSGNVGIGTTSPGEKLTIDSGNISFTTAGQYGLKWPGGSRLFEQTTAQGGVERMLYTPNGSWFDVLNEAGSAYIATIKYNQISFFTGNAETGTTERFRINNAGNVGIGTTNPDYLLDVRGTASISGQLNMASHIIPYTTGQFDLGSASNKWQNVYANNFVGTITPSGFSQGPVVFGGAGGALAQDNGLWWDNSNKRLGIGTTAPATSLEVSKATTGIIRASAADAPATYYAELYGNYSNSDLGGIRTSQGNLIRSSPTSTATFVGVGDIMTILNSGNVGIGTTAPVAKLHVAGTGFFAGDISTASQSGIASQPNNMNVAPNSSFEVNANTAYAVDNWSFQAVAGDGSASITRSSEDSSQGAYSVKTVTTGTTSFTVFNSTFLIPVSPSTSYTQSIDVKGACANGFYSRILWYDQWGNLITSGDPVSNGATTASWVTYSGNVTSPANAYSAQMQFYNFYCASTRYFDNAVLRQTSFTGGINFAVNSGNVGIGTTSPGYKLDVVGTASISGQLNMAAHIIPYADSQFDLGSSSKYWANLYADNVCLSGDCKTVWPSGGSSNWTIANGTIYPINQTLDLIIGGNSTASAKFAVNSVTGDASASGHLTVGQGDQIRSAYGPLNLAYKSGLNAWTTGVVLQDTTGNMGIGTTAPAEKLEVNGNILLTSGSTGKISLGNVTTADSGFYFHTISDQNYYIGRTATAWGAGQPIIASSYYGWQFKTYGSDRMTIDGATGNVGIGTTAPAAKLDITGNLKVSTYATISASLGLGTFSAPEGPGNLAISGFATVSGSLAVQTGLTTDYASVFRIQSSVGNFQGGYFNYDAAGLKFILGTHANNNDFTSDDIESIIMDRTTGYVGIGTTAADERLNVAGNIKLDSANPEYIYFAHNAQLEAGWGAMTFVANGGGDSNGTFNWKYGSAENEVMSLVNGSLGIGTTNPSTKLEVAGAAESATVPTTTAGYNIALGYSGNTTNYYKAGIALNDSNGTVPASLLFVDEGGSAATGIALATGNGSSISERLRITSTGKVGINTTSPLATLDIRGLTLHQPAASASANSSYAALVANNDGLGDLFTASSSGVAKFVITQAGNVGIGTTAPTTNLEVKSGNDDATIYLAGGRAGISHNATSNVVSVGNLAGAAKHLALYAGQAERLRIDGTTGRIGINTTSPLTTLDIRGLTLHQPAASASANSSYAALVANNDGSGDLFTASSSGVTKFTVARTGDLSAATYKDSANSSYYLDPAGATSMLVAGNVGIGTTAPSAKLDIVGDLEVNGYATISSSLAVGYAGGIAGPGNAIFSGNVGIGTTSPLSQLHLTSDMQIGTDGVNASHALTMWSENGYEGIFKMMESTTYGAGLRYNATANNLYIDRYANSTTPTVAMTFARDSGYVGIGTTAPLTTLDIRGLTLHQPAASASANSSFAALVANNDGLGDLFTASSSGVAKFTIKQSGNVGIGTVNPGAALEVAGTTSKINATNDTLYLSATNASGAIVLQTGGSNDRMTIDSTGRVGIGTGTMAQAFVVSASENNTTLGNNTSAVARIINGWTAGFGRRAELQFGIGGTQQTYQTAIIASEYTSWDGTNVAGGTLIFGTKTAASATIAERMRISDAGRVGIGTTAPAFKLDIQDSQASTVAASIYNTNTGTGADGLLIKLGNTSTSAVDAGNRFISFETAGIGIVGKIQGTGAKGATMTANGVDYAEFFPKKENLQPGDLVCLDTDNKAIACRENGRIIGMISLYPILMGGIEGPDKALVSLVGQVPLKVSSQNGNIISGDALGTSNINGYASKAVKAGQTVAKAQQSFQPNETSCPLVSSIEAINWPFDDDGTNKEKPCFKLPDGTYIGKIMAYVNISWYDPDVYLTEAGQLQLIHNSDETYKVVNNTNGLTIDRIMAAASAVFADLKTGILRAGSITTEVLNSSLASIQNLTVGQKITSPLAEIDTLQARQISAAEKIISPLAEVPEISTSLIRPIGTADLIVRLTNTESNNSKFKVEDQYGKALAFIDSQGNASFSGKLSTLSDLSTLGNLGVEGDATVAGTLRAKRIFADEIIGASLSANYITNISNNIYQMATTSGILANSLNIGPYVDISTLSANMAFIRETMAVLGSTLLNQTSVMGTFSQGASLIIDNGNQIEVLTGNLYLQKFRQGGVDIANGQLVIDKDGNLVTEGNLTVKGVLSANIISPLPDHDLAIRLGNEIIQPSFKVENSSGSAVLAVDTKGNLSASGSASAKEFKIVREVEASSNPGEITANSSAGEGKISAHYNNVVIKTPYAHEKSLIYITPVGSTGNQTLFLANIKPETGFTVGIDNAINTDIKFNWWIVN